MFRLIFYLLLISSLTISSSLGQVADFAALTSQLDRIETKLNVLEETISANGGCSCTRRPVITIKRSPPGGDSSSNEPSESSTSPTATPITTQASLVHFNRFNRLADNLNTIQAKPSPLADKPSREGDTSIDNGNKESQQVGQPDDEKQLVLRLEALFDGAFDNLNLIMREQLVGFRLTLNKLINHLADHNYQHLTLASQLATLKDECSFAAAHLSSASASQQSSPPTGTSSTCPNNTTMTTTTTTMRSSDAILIARVLSDSLEPVVRKVLTSSAVANQNTKQQATCSNDQLDEQERHLRLETVLGKGLGTFQRRLDEIDSVVKQTANLLNKRLFRAQENKEQTYTTITVTNDQDQASSSSSSSALRLPSSSRWSAGSKVPSQRQVPAVVHAEVTPPLTAFELPKLNQLPRCQSNVNLNHRTSCSQLREAGDICTGIYLIPVRGGVVQDFYCDMGSADGGGWAVLIRRVDRSLEPPITTSIYAASRDYSPDWMDRIKSSQVDFNRDWRSYKNGFGAQVPFEIFLGLDQWHHLAATSPNNSTTLDASGNELQVDLEAEDGSELHLKFDEFAIASEADQYRFQVGACNLTGTPDLCEPLTRLNGSLFYTQDRPANCSQIVAQNETTISEQQQPPIQSSGWWVPSADTCQPLQQNSTNNINQQAIRLTDPIGRRINGESVHLYWPGWLKDGVKKPLRKIVLKVRQRRRRP